MNKKPIVLCILDGWGIAPLNPGNAVALSRTPWFDKLSKKYPNILLNASGSFVGLPDKQIGNSEVGHLHLGAGRIIPTGLTRINNVFKADENLKNIDISSFLNEPTVKDMIKNINLKLEKNPNLKIHILGLCSFGGVHSYLLHLLGLIHFAKKININYCLHLFSDGRDVNPNSFLKDTQLIIDHFKNLYPNESIEEKFGVISGRYFAMDRNQKWKRTLLAYNAMINNGSSTKYDSLINYIQDCYDKGITDEFIPVATPNNNNYFVNNDDIIISLNFRPDRMKQLCHLLVGSNLYDIPTNNKNLELYTMMEYGGINTDKILFPPLEIKNTFGEVISNLGMKQLRLAETEKYPHVTYFFDGGKKINLPGKDEILINSPAVATYDLKPEMSAEEITNNLCEKLKQYDYIIVNYANPDMVGHSGKLSPTIKAVETVDKQLGIIYQSIKSVGGTLFAVADHGNSEKMFDVDESYWNNNEVSTSKISPHTAHTNNLVKLIITDENVVWNKNAFLSIASIAPTILKYSSKKIPKEMLLESLLI